MIHLDITRAVEHLGIKRTPEVRWDGREFAQECFAKRPDLAARAMASFDPNLWALRLDPAILDLGDHDPRLIIGHELGHVKQHEIAQHDEEEARGIMIYTAFYQGGLIDREQNPYEMDADAKALEVRDMIILEVIDENH